MKITLERFIPKHHDTDSVNFAEMQKKFTDNCWLKTPSAKMLQNSDDVILYRHQTVSSCFTILRSGLVLTNYQHADTKRNTVIPAQKDFCYYPIESGKPIRIPVTDYAMMPFVNALEMLLMFRIDKNANERVRSHTHNYLDSSGNYYEKKEKTAKKLSSVSKTFEDYVLASLEPNTEPDYRTRCKILLDEALTHLTDKQIEVVDLYFGKNLTQQEIANKLNLSRTTVQDRLSGSIKKLKKLCGL